eukprot:comp23547_c0_seq1/m.39734 comp23547_c0_seq1/g.39734  ORF comp23547_c0_seq1/g.39734 comp23547_c0_seq1/m.39734 type:complete len:469 (-) comp23547_c0_seq1:310-1716(-)
MSAPLAGRLFISGNVSWDTVGKSVGKTAKKGAKGKVEEPVEEVHLPVPHSLGLDNVVLVATGAAAAHNFAVTQEGDVYAWGRNTNGQLGLGHTRTVHVPAKVALLCSKDDPVVDIAAGKNHSLFATKTGRLLSCGGNEYGQLGLGSAGEQRNVPTPVDLSASTQSPVTSVKAGIDFSAVLTAAGEVLTFGCPEYGKLGHNTDGQYNTKASSVKMAFAPSPTPKIVRALAGSPVRAIAAGNHHTLAADDKTVYAWGCGAFGRLGGGPTANKDKWVPTPCACDIWDRMTTKSFRLLAAGATFSGTVLGDGMMYLWGRVRPTEEASMYPKPVYDLQGWAIRSLAMGQASVLVAAEQSAVAWGNATAGELGFGLPPTPKSSSKAKKIDPLEGTTVLQVAAGYSHSLFVVEATDAAQPILAKLPAYEPSQDKAPQDEGEEEEEEQKPKGRGRPKAAQKRPAPAAKTSAKRAKK